MLEKKNKILSLIFLTCMFLFSFLLFPTNNAYAWSFEELVGKVLTGEQDISTINNELIQKGVEVDGIDSIKISDDRFKNKSEKTKYIASVLTENIKMYSDSLKKESFGGKISKIWNIKKEMGKNLSEAQKRVEQKLNSGKSLNDVYSNNAKQVLNNKAGKFIMNVSKVIKTHGKEIDEIKDIRNVQKEALSAIDGDKINKKVLANFIIMPDTESNLEEGFNEAIKNNEVNKFLSDYKNKYAYSAQYTREAQELMNTMNIKDPRQLMHFVKHNEKEIIKNGINQFKNNFVKEYNDLRKTYWSLMQNAKKGSKVINKNLPDKKTIVEYLGNGKIGLTGNDANKLADLIIYGAVFDKSTPGYNEWYKAMLDFSQKYGIDFKPFEGDLDDLNFYFYVNSDNVDEELKLIEPQDLVEKHMYISKVVFTITQDTGYPNMQCDESETIKYMNKFNPSFNKAYNDITGSPIPTPKSSNSGNALVVTLDYEEGIKEAVGTGGSFADTIRNEFSLRGRGNAHKKKVADVDYTSYFPSIVLSNFGEKGVYDVNAKVYIKVITDSAEMYHLYDKEEVCTEEKDKNDKIVEHCEEEDVFIEDGWYYPYREEIRDLDNDYKTYIGPIDNDEQEIKPNMISNDLLIQDLDWQVLAGDKLKIPVMGRKDALKSGTIITK